MPAVLAAVDEEIAWRVPDTGPAGTADVLAVHLWRMRDGRAVSFQELTDTARTLQVLGVAAAT